MTTTPEASSIGPIRTTIRIIGTLRFPSCLVSRDSRPVNRLSVIGQNAVYQNRAQTEIFPPDRAARSANRCPRFVGDSADFGLQYPVRDYLIEADTALERHLAMTASGDRLPPQNLEAERSMLGSILLNNEPLHDIVMFLRAEDFYRDAHQVIYASIRDLYDRGKAIDAVTLAEELKKRGQFDAVGGHDILTEIVESVPTAANAKYYANIVKEKATNRQLIESATEILSDGYSNQFTSHELLESAERKIFSIREDQVRGETLELKDIVKLAMDQIAMRAESGGHAVTGLASGFIDLDDKTGGFHPGQLIVLAARPSMGKTALALNISDHVAVKLNVPVLFVSLEMGHIEIADRLLCARSSVDGSKIKTGIGLGHRETHAARQGLSRALRTTA